MHIPQVLRQLCISPRSFTWTPGLFFLGFPHIPGTCTAFLHVFDSWKFICAHPADAPAILNFSGSFTQTPGFSFQLFHTSLRHVLHFYMCVIAGNSFVHILQMLRKFCIFPGHFTQIPGLFFSGFLHFPRTCTTFAHVESFLQLFLPSLGHVLHLHRGCHILFWAFSHQFICAHPADALEIPHFSRVSIRTPGWVFSDFPHIARTYTTS